MSPIIKIISPIHKRGLREILDPGLVGIVVNLGVRERVRFFRSEIEGDKNDKENDRQRTG